MHKPRSPFRLVMLLALVAMVVTACQPAATATPAATAVTDVTDAPATTAPDSTTAPDATTPPDATTAPEATTPPEPTVPAEGQPLYGGTLVVAIWPDLATCNPAITTDIAVAGVLGNVFDGVTREDAKIVVVRELGGLGRRAGLRVEALSGLRDLPESGLGAVPSLIPERVAGFLLGVITLAPACAVLDVSALLDAPELLALREGPLPAAAPPT